MPNRYVFINEGTITNPPPNSERPPPPKAQTAHQVKHSPSNTIIYRIATDDVNLKLAPWQDAIGIEEVELHADGTEVNATPAIVCWLTRGNNQKVLAARIVFSLNYRLHDEGSFW